MQRQKTIDTATIELHDSAHAEEMKRLTSEERGAQIIAACRTAAKIEASRRRMSMPPSQPAPWPESTWTFLKEAASRARGD